jgi:hypothetical protein
MVDEGGLETKVETGACRLPGHVLGHTGTKILDGPLVIQGRAKICRSSVVFVLMLIYQWMYI